MNQEIKAKIDQIIEAHCSETGQSYKDISFNADLNLLESGIYDSLGFLQFIATAEEELGKEIDLSDHDPEDFTNYHTLLEILSQ